LVRSAGSADHRPCAASGHGRWNVSQQLGRPGGLKGLEGLFRPVPALNTQCGTLSGCTRKPRSLAGGQTSSRRHGPLDSPDSVADSADKGIKPADGR
jgi:hypothetical protein